MEKRAEYEIVETYDPEEALRRLLMESGIEALTDEMVDRMITRWMEQGKLPTDAGALAVYQRWNEHWLSTYGAWTHPGQQIAKTVIDELERASVLLFALWGTAEQVHDAAHQFITAAWEQAKEQDHWHQICQSPEFRDLVELDLELLDQLSRPVESSPKTRIASKRILNRFPLQDADTLLGNLRRFARTNGMGFALLAILHALTSPIVESQKENSDEIS